MSKTVTLLHSAWQSTVDPLLREIYAHITKQKPGLRAFEFRGDEGLIWVELEGLADAFEVGAFDPDADTPLTVTYSTRAMTNPALVRVPRGLRWIEVEHATTRPGARTEYPGRFLSPDVEERVGVGRVLVGLRDPTVPVSVAVVERGGFTMRIARLPADWRAVSDLITDEKVRAAGIEAGDLPAPRA